MSPSLFGLVELVLVFGIALAFGVQQVLAVRRLRRPRPPAPPPDPHAEGREGRRGIL